MDVNIVLSWVRYVTAAENVYTRMNPVTTNILKSGN